MLEPHDIRRIAVESYRDPRTVRACYAGRRVAPLALASVRDAAVRLGYPPPGEATSPTNANGVVPAKEATPAAETEIAHEGCNPARGSVPPAPAE
jgi:hypothetical protein